MGNIVLLDELTINKIAAGEVVERPASVIKEMVENSIDAGASSITIEMKNGGISYIRITDNGKGIGADDMELAFERHATSKIRSANDLSMVRSMGFRGEALASITAIANVEMISRTQEQTTGNKIVVEAGKILLMQEAGCPIGTTITVQNLFFNTPVRYKFLKKDYTESGYIEDAVTRLALIHPEIAFKLINMGKTIIQTSGNGKLQDVIYAIYGKDVASAILEVDYTYEDIHITGVVGKPEIARSNRSNQMFFVNQRFVRDKTLASAAESGFKGLLPIGKYGFLIVNVDVAPSKVDVNVHPAKLEVRFQEENNIFKAMHHAIKDTLLQSELVANVKQEEEEIPNQVKYEPEITTKNNITDLFRKIVKNSEKEERKQPDNFIEQIYHKKEETPVIQEITKSEEPQMQELEIQEPVIAQPTSSIEFPKMNVLEEVMQMQERIRNEVKQNPTLHTNIPMQLETEEIDKEEPEDSKEEIVACQNIPQVEEDVVPQEQLQEEQQQEDEIEEIVQIPNIQEEKEELQQTEQEDEIEDTKAFENSQIQEMMDKLNNMEEEKKQGPEFVGMYEKIFGKLPASVEEKQKEEEEKLNAYALIKDNNISVFEEIEEYNKPAYQFIGIAFRTYIIIEIGQEMYIIDQHAAHERIMYEKVKENYYSEEEKDSQMLLLPDVITLTHKEMDILKDNIQMFEQAGFVIQEFGENTIKLEGVPNICITLDTKELFLETLDEINTVARTAKQEIEEKFIATVACKAAVKAHMALTVEEVERLMNDLLQLPNPFTCPHGRPTAIKMDKNDIEKKFARRK